MLERYFPKLNTRINFLYIHKGFYNFSNMLVINFYKGLVTFQHVGKSPFYSSTKELSFQTFMEDFTVFPTGRNINKAE